MRKALKLEGQRFGRLTVIKRVANDRWGSTRWLCRCNCGNCTEVGVGSLRKGLTNSCGCLHKEKTIQALKTHGHYMDGQPTAMYITWENMIQRCSNPNYPHYKHYGARGIMVCERWSRFENFLKDMGEKPEGLTLERRDNNSNYQPNNCCWATWYEQARNTLSNKLNPLKVQIIKKLLKESQLKQWEIAELFYVAAGTISNIHMNETWSDINY